MDYLALLGPVLTLAGLPLIDRLERWAMIPADMGAPARPAETEPSTPTSPGELG